MKNIFSWFNPHNLTEEELIAQFDREWREGDREYAKQMAIKYIDSHPDIQKFFAAMTQDDIVKFVDECRANNEQSQRIQADMYLLALYAPRTIVGKMNDG